MPTNQEESTEITEVVNDFNSVSENSLDSDLLRDISNELKVINENEILIIHRLDSIEGVSSVSDNDVKAIRNGVNDILASVSDNSIEYDSIISKEFSEYSLTESFLLIMCILLFLLLVFQFFKGKNYF